MKRILYIGGFELPDKNAAAQRVLSNAKLFKQLCEYEVFFCGITKNGSLSGRINEFNYKANNYPTNLIQWIWYLLGLYYIPILKENKPNIIIAYNLPSFTLLWLTPFCKSKGIKLIGDITEWYHAKNPIKWLDTTLRMRFLNFHMDGLILISSYLMNYYKRLSDKIVCIPPLVDIKDKKWHSDSTGNNKISVNNKINLVYIGSPGTGEKDRLDYIVKAVNNQSLNNLYLTVVGITENEYKRIFGDFSAKNNIIFYGRISHRNAIDILKQSDFQIILRENNRVNNAGFPTKLVEAITGGISVISSDISDVTKFVTDKKRGFIIDSLCEYSINKVISDIALMKREQIEELKFKGSESEIFDYRNYSTAMKQFLDIIN